MFLGPGRSIARNRERKWQKSMIDYIIGAEREYGGCGKSQGHSAMNPVNRYRAPLPTVGGEVSRTQALRKLSVPAED